MDSRKGRVDLSNECVDIGGPLRKIDESHNCMEVILRSRNIEHCHIFCKGLSRRDAALRMFYRQGRRWPCGGAVVKDLQANIEHACHAVMVARRHEAAPAQTGVQSLPIFLVSPPHRLARA